MAATICCSDPHTAERERPMTDFPAADRAAYPLFQTMTTRWRDNDVYGHMNNVVYYEYFDTAVNKWLAESGALPVPGGAQVGLLAESGCRFLHAVGYPETLEIGLGVLRVGSSSVVYGLGLFRQGATEAAALCRYVHVYVDAESHRPVPIPDGMRAKLAEIAV